MPGKYPQCMRKGSGDFLSVGSRPSGSGVQRVYAEMPDQLQGLWIRWVRRTDVKCGTPACLYGRRGEYFIWQVDTTAHLYKCAVRFGHLALCFSPRCGVIADTESSNDPIYVQLVAEQGDAVTEAQRAAEAMRQAVNGFRKFYLFTDFSHLAASPWMTYHQSHKPRTGMSSTTDGSRSEFRAR